MRSILDTQFSRASRIISENMVALDRVAEMLIEYERVSGEEFAAVFSGTSPADILKKVAPKRKRKKPEAKPEEAAPEAQGVPV